MSFNIEVESGTSIRLPTAGKYCDRDIVITATGGGVSSPTTISGVNLHDTSTDILNTYVEGSAIIEYKGWTSTDYIPVEDGKYYLVCSLSSINAKYCSRFDATKKYVSAFSGAINCTDKNRPLFFTGYDGYVRFSGTTAQIAALEFYEIVNFVWSVD